MRMTFQMNVLSAMTNSTIVVESAKHFVQIFDTKQQLKELVNSIADFVLQERNDPFDQSQDFQEKIQI